jgi:hypothetical protein
MSDEAPRYAWVLNLDAEFELAQKGYTPQARLLSQLEQYGRDSQRLLGASDVLVPRNPTASVGPRQPRNQAFRGRAWCPTPRALAELEAFGVEPEPHPDVQVVTRVNHRRFALELGVGLEGQRNVEDKSELERVLRDATRPLLTKRPLAFAGRGQQRVYAHERITEKEWSWIDLSLEQNGLVVEPLVVPTLELSLHGFVWQSGRFELGRGCLQEVSERGVFRGVRLAEPGEITSVERATLFGQGERVAVALASAGYFGPFGIDAYRYELDSRSGFCALGEINARYTMGFAVGFPRPANELHL